MYTVRQAKEQDLDRILEIYSYARGFMARTGNPNQWGKTNPPRHVLEADIAKGDLYIVEREKIHGVFAYLTGEDPTYGYIEGGSWLSDAPYGTIHRVASDGSGGVFAALMVFALEQNPHLRIDTHRDNKVMQHVVEKHGFQYRGVIYLADGNPRLAYERT